MPSAGDVCFPIGVEIAGLSKQAELIGGGVFFSGFGAYVFSLLPVEQALCIQLFEALGNGGQLLDVLEEHLLDGWSAQAGSRMVKGHIGATIGEFGLSVNGGNLRSGKKRANEKRPSVTTMRGSMAASWRSR